MFTLWESEATMTPPTHPETEKMIEQKKREEWMAMAMEVKSWLEERDIQLGYTDTHLGHLASFILDKVASGRAQGEKEERKLICRIFDLHPESAGAYMIHYANLWDFLSAKKVRDFVIEKLNDLKGEK